VPIYEYQCQTCEHRLEALQRMSEPPLTTCPDCGGELRKLVSAPAFQFKGSGWYVTDYARKDGEKKGKEAAAPDKPEKKEEKSAPAEGSKPSKEPSKAAKTAGA
jgi:putative FmdB family regulatory protein